MSFQLEASLNAIRDAGLKPSDIDGLIPYGHGAVAEDFVTNFGIQDLRFSATTPMGGASAVAAIQCALAVIQAYPWPGNARELRNVMQRAHLLADSGVIGIEHLPAEQASSSSGEVA